MKNFDRTKTVSERIAYDNNENWNNAGHRIWEGNMLFSELRCKDVINIKDCRKLGRVCDLEFDECKGCICKIIVPAGNKMLNFLRCEPDIEIPYRDICQIGPEVILVDIKDCCNYNNK